MSRHGLGAAALGVCALVFGAYTLKQARASQSWPTVTGTIVGSGLAYSTTADRNQPDFARERRASVAYRYEVDGKVYAGHTVSFSDDALLAFLWPARNEERIVARYPAGTAVTVHYDPSDPSLAAIEAGGGIQSFVFLAGGVVALVYAGREALR